jgi:hypothetical protein
MGRVGVGVGVRADGSLDGGDDVGSQTAATAARAAVQQQRVREMRTAYDRLPFVMM